MALLAFDRRATLFGRIRLEDGTIGPLRVLVIGKDDHAFTAELADGDVPGRGVRVTLDGLGFFQVMAIARTRTGHGERTYLRLQPTPLDRA